MRWSIARVILTRGARVTGAVLCGVLAVIVASWLVRDIRAVESDELWRYWAGFYGTRPHAMPATTAMDVALFVVYVVAAVAALRSSVAAAVLVTTGVVTLAVRLPGLWNIGSRVMESSFSDDLRTRALICAFAGLAAGIALLITAGAGRRPCGRFLRAAAHPARTGRLGHRVPAAVRGRSGTDRLGGPPDHQVPVGVLLRLVPGR